LQIVQQVGRKDVIAYCAHHVDWIAEPRHGDGLVRAFTAGCGGEVRSDESLACARNRGRAGHEIHVDAADDDNGLAVGARVHLISP